MMKNKKLRAIDLYSGVGGWALGLRLAGIEVVASYERWGVANETNFKNNRHQAQTVDIRRLQLEELPDNIDIVVGSPPCTQFSYANRGGSGDISDGLQDIIKFLTIVDHLKPTLWAMENVPRVAKIIESELRPGGVLERFQHLNIVPHTVNMEHYGLPQRRRRCIAGNFDFNLLKSYEEKTIKRTLGDIVNALSKTIIRDPIYGIELDVDQLRDHITEDSLNVEEVRINKASKTCHPVYNSMSFPDQLNRPVRTITATCTRVSRESIVIENPIRKGEYRRLTVRERACLQGFPVTFQFYGSTYGQKLRMVGNAVPPAFTYYVGMAFKGIAAKDLLHPSSRSSGMESPNPPPSDARPDRPGANYSLTRTFRFAIPSLRLKSGVRFELVNVFEANHVGWQVNFYFGSSKSIQSLKLNQSVYTLICKQLTKELKADIEDRLDVLVRFIKEADISRMQRLWSHNGVGRTRAFMLLDQLDEVGANIIFAFENHELFAQELVGHVILAEHGTEASLLPGLAKLSRNARLILAGLLVGAVANIELNKHMLYTKAFKNVVK